MYNAFLRKTLMSCSHLCSSAPIRAYPCTCQKLFISLAHIAMFQKHSVISRAIKKVWPHTNTFGHGRTQVGHNPLSGPSSCFCRPVCGSGDMSTYMHSFVHVYTHVDMKHETFTMRTDICTCLKNILVCISCTHENLYAHRHLRMPNDMYSSDWNWDVTVSEFVCTRVGFHANGAFWWILWQHFQAINMAVK